MPQRATISRWSLSILIAAGALWSGGRDAAVSALMHSGWWGCSLQSSLTIMHKTWARDNLNSEVYIATSAWYAFTPSPAAKTASDHSSHGLLQPGRTRTQIPSARTITGKPSLQILTAGRLLQGQQWSSDLYHYEIISSYNIRQRYSLLSVYALCNTMLDCPTAMSSKTSSSMPESKKGFCSQVYFVFPKNSGSL